MDERPFKNMADWGSVNPAGVVAFKQELHLAEPTAKHAGARKPLENSIRAR